MGLQGLHGVVLFIMLLLIKKKLLILSLIICVVVYCTLAASKTVFCIFIHVELHDALCTEEGVYLHAIWCDNPQGAQYIQVYVNECMCVKSSQVKLSFIVIPLHVGTYSGTKCRASQDHGAT